MKIMGKLVVVQGDAVQGTDAHTVTWVGPTPPGAPGAGTANYKYMGSITAMLSSFVTIAGQPVALTSSQSSLKPGAAGGHLDALGTFSTPPAPPVTPGTLKLVPAIIGLGKPNAASGSALLTIGGTKVLLDGDKMDTCDGRGSANSTITASGQSFVTCSA
jgi:hypothetical protein